MPSSKTVYPELVRVQMEKILSTAGFVRNDRLSGFLRFLVERDVAGRADELKESVVGVEFFGRQSDYDVRQTFSGAISYDIPAPGRGIWKSILGSWSTDSIVYARTAPPVRAGSGPPVRRPGGLHAG